MHDPPPPNRETWSPSVVEREVRRLTFDEAAGLVADVAYSPDGRRLATASDDQTVKVWGAATGQDLLTLKGHTSRVSGVAYSPDGHCLASASWDQTVAYCAQPPLARALGVG
jgi:WD40 repeat protein